jgi:hypothetical protein
MFSLGNKGSSGGTLGRLTLLANAGLYKILVEKYSYTKPWKKA